MASKFGSNSTSDIQPRLSRTPQSKATKVSDNLQVGISSYNNLQDDVELQVQNIAPIIAHRRIRDTSDSPKLMPTHTAAVAESDSRDNDEAQLTIIMDPAITPAQKK